MRVVRPGAAGDNCCCYVVTPSRQPFGLHCCTCRCLPRSLLAGCAMRVLNAVTSLLESVLASGVKSPPADPASGVVKRHGDPTLLSKPRVRGHALQKVRAAHFRMYPLCVHCRAEGRVSVATELDHVVALVNGGLDFDQDDGANRQGLCKTHHARKTAADLGYEYIERCEIGLDGWPKPSLPCLTGSGTLFGPSPSQPHSPSFSPMPGGRAGQNSGGRRE